MIGHGDSLQDFFRFLWTTTGDEVAWRFRNELKSSFDRSNEFRETNRRLTNIKIAQDLASKSELIQEAIDSEFLVITMAIYKHKSGKIDFTNVHLPK